MNRATFRLVLIISCAHAMVHMFEHALPAVELMIGKEFDVGRDWTGMLGTVWRLPFGLGAMLAGWLADRYGAKRLLTVYLLGCMATCGLAAWAPTLAILFGVMFLMGCFASIYHPAGLSLLSRETTPATRGAALGWHGIFGSVGIAIAPFLAALVFSTGLVGWRGYYLLLACPALIIVLLVSRLHVHTEDERKTNDHRNSDPTVAEETIDWRRLMLLVSAGALSGFVYAAFLYFLPRYLNDTGLRPTSWSEAGFRNTLTTVALLFAAVGQGVAGRLADPGRLERQLTFIFFANVPPLMWMAFAEGPWRFVAACLLAFIHFMNQPVYNSLIADVVPHARRSLGYGFSNMMCFGIGAFGPLVAGLLPSDEAVYALLGGLAAMAGGVSLLLVGVKAE